LPRNRDEESNAAIQIVTLDAIAQHPIPLKYAHELCHNLHRSLVKGCPSPVFTGQEMGQPRQNHGHTFMQPIRDQDKRYLQRLQLISPEGYFSDALAAISAVPPIRVGEQWATLQLTDFSLTLGESYQQWETVTPMFLTRFPKTLRGKPRYFPGTQYQKDGPEHQALKYLLFLDHLELSGKPTFQATQEGLGLYLGGEFAVEAQCQPWQNFWEWQTTLSHGKKVGRVGYNVKLTFSKSVTAPIALGYACHYGLGTLRPI
jgi:CRISPR-associated protein Csb2